MTRGAKVIVAGAGALGLSTALVLADAGCTVMVCDPASGPRASAVAAGMLAPVFETVLDGGEPVDLDLLLAARNLWPALAGRAGIEIDRSGAVAVGPPAWLAGVRAGLTRLGLSGADLPRPLLDDLAPGVAADAEGVLSREDWRLDPRAALNALRQAAEAAGVVFRTEAVTGRGDADWLVVATGAGQGLAGLAPELQALTPIKGQILRYADRCGARVSLRGEGAYAVSGTDGLAIGATMEPGRTDTEADLASLAPLIAAAERLFPALAGANFSISAGVRAATPDGLPLVGPAAAPGVILAVGARRNGWLLAPLVARLVTACVIGADAGPYAARLDPERFAGDRGKGQVR
ncbi:MAG TPA: FAD-dependent oxidoreductase [Phenylobacterium sp.]|jgi:glycine oxidase|nr:FAD-dependent oxidoreductase [Phenylobacterium sp.]